MHAVRHCLARLDVSGVLLQPQPLVLPAMEALEHLCLREHELQLAEPRSLTRLTRVSLGKYDNEIFGVLSGLPALSNLHVMFGRPLPALSSLSRLTALVLKGYVRDDAFVNLTPHSLPPALRHVCMHGCTLNCPHLNSCLSARHTLCLLGCTGAIDALRGPTIVPCPDPNL